jgi:hypothetical protein
MLYQYYATTYKMCCHKRLSLEFNVTHDDDDGVNCVSELQPYIIPRVIYEHGEPLWNDINRENSLLIHQSSLAILPAVI